MTKKLVGKKFNEKYRGVFPFQFDENADGVSIPDIIHLIPMGQWEHDLYGQILITRSDIQEFAQNFNAGIRKGVFITAGHEGYAELPAQGWITKVEVRDNGLWGMVEWNELGKETLSDKQFKFFSPEFYRDYEDPQTHQLYRNVLTGGALTKQPYFKELEAVVFSEPKLKETFNENNTMDLKDLLVKKIEDLSDDEKAFIKSHAAELTDEQKVSHTAIIDAPAEETATETDEEKSAREAKEASDKEAENVAAGLNADGSAKTAEQLSEKILISASELAVLRAKADQGANAFKELSVKKLNDSVSALVFGENNKTGRFLPKSQDILRTFMETLNDIQRASFTSLIAQLPKSESFKEIGGEGSDANSFAVVEAKVSEKMKADSKLSYSDALKQVMSENPGLEQKFDEELVPVRVAKK